MKLIMTSGLSETRAEILPFAALSEEIIDAPDWVAHLNRLKNPWLIITSDVDHTLEDTKPLADESGNLSPRKYIEFGFKPDLENLDLMVILAVLGRAVNLCTGKGFNFLRIGRYLKERFPYWGKILDFIDNKELDGSFPDPLLRERPPFLAISNDNGAVSFEVISLTPMVYMPIPLSGWEFMQRNRDLLADSTEVSRKNQIAQILEARIPYRAELDRFTEADRTTNQIHCDKLWPILSEVDLRREIEPDLTKPEQEHRAMLAADIRDHVLFFDAEFAKANYVFDFSRIINDGDLNQRWLDATGIKITDKKTFMKAFKSLADGAGVELFFSEAQGVLYVDVVAEGVNKGLNSKVVKELYKARLRLSQARRLKVSPNEIQLPKISSVAFIDNGSDDSNDAALMEKNSGTAVVGHHTYRKKNNHGKGSPVYLEDVYEVSGKNLRNAEMTNLYLKDVLRIICPKFAEKIIRQVEQEFVEKVN